MDGLRGLGYGDNFTAFDTANAGRAVAVTVSHGTATVTPFAPTNPEHVRAIAISNHSGFVTPLSGCVIDADGRARCFDFNNGVGQLGVGNHSVPPGLPYVVEPQ